jgi:hypothetical protein
MARGNQIRGTPGLMLCVFVVFAASCLFLLLEKRFMHSEQSPKIEHLSGLGDVSYYSTFSKDDFNQSTLFFAQKPKGCFRRSDEPEAREDGSMQRFTLENSGKYIVYTEAHSKNDEEGRKVTRYFLKAGEGLYVEFGDRNHWPAFEKGKP